MSEINLHCDDWLKVIPDLPDNYFDAIITDPPYGVNISDWDQDMPSQYFLDQCLRVARGPVVWFGAAPRMMSFADYDPQPDRILIWSPKFTLSKVAKNGFAYRYHPIAVWRIEDQDVIPWDVIDDMTETGNGWYHPATKPVALMRKLVAAWEPDSILDPFMGSGTTGVACIQLGKAFMGIEINNDYFEIAKKRIAEARMQLRLSI